MWCMWWDGFVDVWDRLTEINFGIGGNSACSWFYSGVYWGFWGNVILLACLPACSFVKLVTVHAFMSGN